VKLLVVFHAGDYRETYNRLKSGGSETYYAQRYWLDAYESALPYTSDITVLTCLTEKYDEMMPNGIRAMGAGMSDFENLEPLLQLIASLNPTHVVVTVADWRLLRWIAKQGYRCLTVFGSSVPRGTGSILKKVAAEVRGRLIAYYLNKRYFDWIGSYGLASTSRLRSFGVKPNKLIPWDLLIEPDAGSFTPKRLRKGAADFNVCFVGAAVEGKGVLDLVDAIAILNSEGFAVAVTIVGKDSDDIIGRRVNHHGIPHKTTFVGHLPSSEIEPLMHQMDVVVVPSHHTYPEGFPLVIHHGLRARTPLVTSDHPMFRRHLRDRENALIFPAANPAALAASIKELLTNEDLYFKLSEASKATWLDLRLDVKWHEMFLRWVRRSSEDWQWFAAHSIQAIEAMAK